MSQEAQGKSFSKSQQFLLLVLYFHRAYDLFAPFSANDPHTVEIDPKQLGELKHVRAAHNAVVHIGPYKTGSTTIQYLTQIFSAQLLADGYSMPYSHTFANGTSVSNPWSNQVQVATCFLEDTNIESVLWPCRADLLEAGRDIGQRRQSILLSAETFSGL